ncbi:Saxiphilin [Liparis tanakae]|uniref:Saxiphilin n=1 Tax=Liparis tanakae TaxID=230148 RepID=A0A4Z2HHF8_9TELE|nr:Saxiphilin [Liparis tanakae]
MVVSLQCHGSTGHCWCVDVTGQERAGTRTPPGRPSVDCDRPVCTQRPLDMYQPPAINFILRPSKHLKRSLGGKMSSRLLRGDRSKIRRRWNGAADGVIAVSKDSSQITDEYLPDQRSHLYGIAIATTHCLSGTPCSHL